MIRPAAAGSVAALMARRVTGGTCSFHQGRHEVHDGIDDPPCQVAAERADEHRADFLPTGFGGAQRSRKGEGHDEAEQDLREPVDWLEQAAARQGRGLWHGSCPQCRQVVTRSRQPHALRGATVPHDGGVSWLCRGLLVLCRSRARTLLFFGLPPAAERPIELDERHQLRPASLGEPQLLVEELLVGIQDLEVVGEARVVARAGELRGITQRLDALLQLQPRLPLLLDRHQ